MDNLNDMKDVNGKIEEADEKITPWYLLTLIKPILADELVAKLRFDTKGLRVSFCNGQKFRVRIEEI